MAKNENLTRARKEKNDEFYTQMSDIEKELQHYTSHFKDKVVYCNCNDGFSSNFFRYFAMNFVHLKLKKLIGIKYKRNEDDYPAYKIELTTEIGDENGDGAFDFEDVEEFVTSNNDAITFLTGDGSYDSEESLRILKEEADIVVTNPPFSKFRDYIRILMEYKKKFIIVGNVNAITYAEIFPLIKENKMWVGYKFNGAPMKFNVPDDYELHGSVNGIDENGNKYIGVGGTCWYTNLDIPKLHEDMILFKQYEGHEEEYPKYDNYDAINVDKTKDIPLDYKGKMGVPITFLDKYNPDQFKILELGNSRDNFTPTKDYINPKKVRKDGTIVAGGAINCVLAIEVNEAPEGKVYYTSDNSKYLVPPYARVIVQRI